MFYPFFFLVILWLFVLGWKQNAKVDPAPISIKRDFLLSKLVGDRTDLQTVGENHNKREAGGGD